MFSAIASALSAILGMGALLGGPTTTGPTNPDTAGNAQNNFACYSPSPSEMITLTWPDNFVNLTDKRKTLNPHIFGSRQQYFNTNENCRKTMFIDTDGNIPPTSENPISRTYIKVRDNLRLSSCKTDELAGPYAGGECTGWENNAAELTHRGSCNASDYTDLRKVAEVSAYGQIQEIFWNPYTHNMICGYDPNSPNCGPGGDRDIRSQNLREFIYVLRSRDAFDVTDEHKGCKALWDAGSTNKDACSHYFDVYMAEDLYSKTLSQDIDSNDYDYKAYKFVKEQLENCRENSTFTPIVDVPGIRIPPQFIELPFVSQDFYRLQNGKITTTAQEFPAYERSVLSTSAINPGKTSLVEMNAPTNGTISVCTGNYVPTPTPDADGNTGALPTCYISIGSIPLHGNNQDKIFHVYTRIDTPQTFYLKDESGADPGVYQYTITVDEPPWRSEHDPSLQLSQLRFSSENEWTWATPWCKPALYFYPEKPTQLNVKLELDGVLTESDPLYDPSNGWNILARPDGSLFHTPNTTYQIPNNYLYYEADISNVELPKTGWVIEQSAVSNTLSSLMKTTGFNEKETADFLAYWLPRLQEKPYYFIGILPEEIINEKEKLVMNAHPDTLIRVRFIFEGLDQPVSVNKPVDIPSYQRTGFVVADWGGTIVGKSCKDVTVQ